MGHCPRPCRRSGKAGPLSIHALVAILKKARLPEFKGSYTPCRSARALILAFRPRAPIPFADTPNDWNLLRRMGNPREVKSLKAWTFQAAIKLRDLVSQHERKCIGKAKAAKLRRYCLADLRCMICLKPFALPKPQGKVKQRIKKIRSVDTRRRTGDRHKSRSDSRQNSAYR